MEWKRKTHRIYIGDVAIGGGAPVSIQSMTTTHTADVDATLAQIHALAEAGAELVRVAVPTKADAEALKQLCPQSPVPLIADIHFDHRLALASIEAGIHGLRLNPGNIGGRDWVKLVVLAAKKAQIPIRIGVNGGSVDKTLLAKYGRPCPEALVESALRECALLESLDFYDIKVSLKTSSVPETVKAYRLFAQADEERARQQGRLPYALHLGVTEAGNLRDGTLKSAIGIGALLLDGLGDTIRVSLTADPVEEVHAARKILELCGLRTPMYEIISCPTCGRTEVDLFGLADRVEALMASLDFKKPVRVAVMGCMVNGPGEAREVDLGIAGGRGCGVIFKKGEIVQRCTEEELLPAFQHHLRDWL